MTNRTLNRTAPAPNRDWADLGRCATADPELFFPQPGADSTVARAICRTCPVRRQCLEYALVTGQRHGIWGGMTESQRRRLRRHHPAAGTPMADEVEPADEAADDTAVVLAPVRHLRLVQSTD